MIVDVDLAASPATVELVEPDDLKRFHVAARGGSDDQAALARALEGVGSVSEDGHAWIRTDALLQLAGQRSDDAEWRSSFDGMVGYARSKGWVDDSKSSLRAHVEWG